MQNFRDFKKEIIPSAEAIAAFTGQIRAMMVVLSTATADQIPGIIKTFTRGRADVQTQAGKKGP